MDVGVYSSIAMDSYKTPIKIVFLPQTKQTHYVGIFYYYYITTFIWTIPILYPYSYFILLIYNQFL